MAEKCVQLAFGLPPASKLGRAWLPCCPPWAAARPVCFRQDSGAVRGGALTTDRGTSSSATRGVLLCFEAPPARGTALSEPVGWLPADLSAFLFSERGAGCICLMLYCRLAPARKWPTRCRGQGRRALPPRLVQESKTFPSEILGFDSQEVMSTAGTGWVRFLTYICTGSPFRCKLKNELAKQLKQAARTAKTLQCGGRRTFNFQSRDGFPIQPLRDHFFAPLPSQVLLGSG